MKASPYVRHSYQHTLSLWNKKPSVDSCIFASMQKIAYRVAAVIVSIFETIKMGIRTGYLCIVYGKDAIQAYNSMLVLRKANELLGNESPESLRNLVASIFNDKNNLLPKTAITISKEDMLTIRSGLAKRNISAAELAAMA